MSCVVCAKSLQLCPTLCDPMDWSPLAILSMGFSRQKYWSGLQWPSVFMGSSQPRGRTHVSWVSWILGLLGFLPLVPHDFLLIHLTSQSQIYFYMEGEWYWNFSLILCLVADPHNQIILNYFTLNPHHKFKCAGMNLLPILHI